MNVMLDSNQSTDCCIIPMLGYTIHVSNWFKFNEANQKTRNKSSRIPNKDSFCMTYNSFTLTLYVIW